MIVGSLAMIVGSLGVFGAGAGAEFDGRYRGARESRKRKGEVITAQEFRQRGYLGLGRAQFEIIRGIELAPKLVREPLMPFFQEIHMKNYDDQEIHMKNYEKL
jgi:hypothetical protein